MVKKGSRSRGMLQIDPPADIVDDVLRRVIEMAPAFSAALAIQIAREVRHEWAGERSRICYIARRGDEDMSARNAAIRRDFHAGERVGFLARKYRLSERRIQQIVSGRQEPPSDED
jgi:Mor family transcriptional regulator